VSYPYVQAAHHGGKQTTVNRVVIHATVSPCVRGGAKSIANYFHNTVNQASAHYVADPGAIYQCLLETTIGWHAPPNTGSIGIELCDPQSGKASRWADGNHEAMLALAAKLTREVAGRWKVPLVKLSAADLKAGRRGICGHVDVSNAWHLTDHGDPMEAGPFPWSHFMNLVTQEDDLPLDSNDLNKVHDATWKRDDAPAPGSNPNDPWAPKNWDPKTNATWKHESHQVQQTQGLIVIDQKVDRLAAEIAEIKALLEGK
jgi:hypothetical protein